MLKRFLLSLAVLVLLAPAAWAIDTGTQELGCVQFNGTSSGLITVCAPATAGTPAQINLPSTTGTNGQVLSTNGGTPQVTSWTNAGTGTVTSVTCGTGLSGGTITATGTCAVLPVPTTIGSSTGNTFTAPAGFFVCSSTCTVTPPVPAAGDQFCVWNGNNVSTVITLGAIGSSAFYQNTAQTAYGTAGTGTLVSGGAVGDKLCIVGVDATHYQTVSFKGTWTAS